MKKLPKLLESIKLVFPYLIIFTYSLLIIEMFTYPGFLRKYLLLNSHLFVFITLLILIFVAALENFQLFSNQIQMQIVMNLSKLFLPVLILIYIIFIAEEQRNFPNYVFSRYHIHYQQIEYLLLLNLGIIAIYSVFSSAIFEKIKGIRQKSISLFLFSISALFLCLWIFIQNLTSNLSGALETLPYIASHLFANYEEKLTRRVSVYQYLKFVNEHSPESATIAIPPQQNPWLTVGNGGYIRYFLYPRHEINIELNSKIPPEADYALIARGTWAAPDPSLYGWPKERINAIEIWEFDWKTNKAKLVPDRVYDPVKSNIDWGLIRIK